MPPDLTGMAGAKNPLGRASVSLGLHIHEGIPDEAVRLLMKEAQFAEQAGFDGLTISEHHGGAPNYLPNPLLASGWVLSNVERVWVAPSPVVLPLRPTRLLLEDLAWLCSAFPWRVGIGLAPGWSKEDFIIAGAPLHDRADLFEAGLMLVARVLEGRDDPPLTLDPAVAMLPKWSLWPLSAAGGMKAVRRAVRAKMGLILSGFRKPERIRRLTEGYEEAGGTGVKLLIRRGWIGSDAPHDVIERLFANAESHSWVDAGTDSFIWGDKDEFVEKCSDVIERSEVDALNIRIHAPGIDHRQVVMQIERFAEVIPHIKLALLKLIESRQSAET